MLHPPSTSPQCITRLPIGFGEAVALAVEEIERLGLAATYAFAGLYAAPDAHTEGADFAAMLVRRDGGRGAGSRLKPLIACDGRVSVRPFAVKASHFLCLSRSN